MSASIIKNLITPAIKKAVTTAGKNTAAQNRAINNAAKKADMTPTEFKKKAKQVINESKGKGKSKGKKNESNQTKTSGAENRSEGSMSKTLTPSEFKKLSPKLKALYRQQQEEIKGSQNILPRRRATGPKGQEVEQGPLLSKVLLPENVSPARKRNLIAQGKARMTKQGMKGTGEFAPSRQSIAEEMGLGGKGSLPTEEQLRGMGGFEIKKYGGKVKRRMGGKVRGYGKAMRGY